MFSICGGYCFTLATLFSGHHWIVASSGRPRPCDFLAFWAAGGAALSGHAAVAYDAPAFHVVQTAVAGPFPGLFYWNYPPAFFLVAALLAVAPYLFAFLVWAAATLTAYAVTVGVVFRRWEGALAACASPLAVLTAFEGQNGFLTAALLGSFLMLLPRQPIVSGILLGLMTYKPQLGILFPIALIAGGHWRALCSAAATAALIAGAAALAFGPGIYGAFLHSLPVVTHAYLTLGGEGWVKMQSVYSIARFVGAADSVAWLAQVTVIMASAAAVIWLWRSELAYEIKAASLTLAAMLSTPYLHMYDFPVLLVALGFLYRHRAFDRIEWSIAIAANLVLPLYYAQIVPIGPGIVMLVIVLILRRATRLAEPALPEFVPVT
ncbi:MAG TPA: glycosyltransferase family 87 protein [Rhizomicrobium sp.]|nr:glycosyltransferase family 87 protein [Rhizomicrobium sp.]